MRALRPFNILSLPPPLLLSTLTWSYRLTAPSTSPVSLSLLLQQCPRRPFSSLPPQPKEALSFKLAASFSGKGRHFNHVGDIYTPPPDPAIEGLFTGRPISGQDSFFISRLAAPPSDKTTSSKTIEEQGDQRNISGTAGGSPESGWAFGVLDGVGGWSDSGFDSAHFSHGMAESLARLASLPQPPSSASTDIPPSPRSLLSSAYKSIISAGHIRGGGTTACIATASPSGHVSVANLGDSGFALFRAGEGVAYFSNPQTHAFNTPFQLSIVPPRILALSRAFGGGPLRDMPRDAEEIELEVQRGDVLVFGTDGVWDNLTPEEVGQIVDYEMRNSHAWRGSNEGDGVRHTLEEACFEGEEAGMGGTSRQDISVQEYVATAIVGQAKRASLDSETDGPFAREVQKHYPEDNWRGGKVDDICVVVGVVVDARAPREPDTYHD